MRFDGQGTRSYRIFYTDLPDALSQDFTLAAGQPAVLSYYLRSATSTPPHDSALTVRVDNTVIQSINEPLEPESEYSKRTIAIPSQFADGGLHRLSFTYTRPNSSPGEIVAIDDVSLLSCSIPEPVLFSISGRTVTETGTGIRNAAVAVIRDDGVVRSTTTSSFGVFSVDGLEPGRTYTVSIRSKRYRFATRVIELTANVTDLTMFALE